jgi:ubiquinone/menaquinone biosynthesis C-methylase UbiE
MKLHYDLWYRFGTPPWVGPARSELVNLVETGVLTPGRAVDLGCGEGDNAIFLAGTASTSQHSTRRPLLSPRHG